MTAENLSGKLAVILHAGNADSIALVRQDEWLSKGQTTFFVVMCCGVRGNFIRSLPAFNISEALMNEGLDIPDKTLAEPSWFAALLLPGMTPAGVIPGKLHRSVGFARRCASL